MVRLVVMGMLMLMPLLALADKKNMSVCRYADDALIERMRTNMVAADAIIPPIPPEEQRYLEAETKSLMHGDADKTSVAYDRRWQALTSRPLYYAWKARNELTPLAKGVNDLFVPFTFLDYKNREAAILQRAIKVSGQWAGYSVVLADFLFVENRRQPSLLTAEQHIRLHTDSVWGRVDINQFMQCKLAKAIAEE